MKEMVVDFRRERTETTPMTIRGEDVDVVDSYKYLAVYLNVRLDWSTNTYAVYMKGMRQTVFPSQAQILQHLQQDVGDLLPVCGSKRHLLCCCLLGGSISAREVSRIYRLIRKVGNISQFGSQILY